MMPFKSPVHYGYQLESIQRTIDTLLVWLQVHCFLNKPLKGGNGKCV